MASKPHWHSGKLQKNRICSNTGNFYYLLLQYRSCLLLTSKDYFQDENKFKQLDSIWPNLDQPRPEYDRLGSRVLAQSFWGHEWKKHGTCSENMYNQTQYFDLAIKLKNRYNLLSILEQGGLSRGHSHELSDVNSTIWRTTHGTPDLKCLNDARVHRNVPVLQEIGICYRPSKNRSGQVSFSVINCPHSRTRTCYRGLGNGKIVFP